MRAPVSRRGRSFLVLGAVLAAALNAQAPPPPPPPQAGPFLSPSEMAHSTKRREIEASPAQNGRWDTLPYLMPVNPVHAALMRNGKVLIVSGSGNDIDNKNFQAAVWDPRTYTVRTFQIAWDMFCNGMVILPDGRPFVLGGTLKYDDFLGEPRTAAFNPATETFTDLQRMSGGRWYPTGTVLGDGSVLAYSGLTDTASVLNRTVQIWKNNAWTAAGTAFASLDLYPREHLLPNGKVFESGWNVDSQLYDPVARSFSFVTNTLLPERRVYGTSVLLPLTPANGFKPRVMILGGGSPSATRTTELIDLSVSSPRWVQGPPMAQPRVQLNATLLPDGKVLVSGGSKIDEDGGDDSAVKAAQLFDPESDTFSSGSRMEFPRLYHSVALLLPDATVVAMGGNPQRKVYQPEIEIYSPPYLFNADGSRAQRPSLTGVPTGIVAYGAQFQVQTSTAREIRSAVLVRPGAVTHAFDMEQRLVGLRFTLGTGTGTLNLRAPANGNLAPPGYYLLFLLNAQGVPSLGRFVRLG